LSALLNGGMMWSGVGIASPHNLLPLPHRAQEKIMTLKAVVIQKGPLMVSGDLSELEITDSNGQAIDLGDKNKIYLCRCGGSVNKPFCDGTHSKIGFQAAEAAVQANG
jgi:3-phenylpropionate/trans-cinnamate dioxygenase ferredoxin subunit